MPGTQDNARELYKHRASASPRDSEKSGDGPQGSFPGKSGAVSPRMLIPEAHSSHAGPFSLLAELMRFSDRGTGVNTEKRFPCEFCGRAFSQGSEWERHVLRHGM